jgi:hypothetical protein
VLANPHSVIASFASALMKDRSETVQQTLDSGNCRDYFDSPETNKSSTSTPRNLHADTTDRCASEPLGFIDAGPERLANLLRASSPARMRSFAVAMHEIQCERGDMDHADLWQTILRLSDEPALSDESLSAKPLLMMKS